MGHEKQKHKLGNLSDLLDDIVYCVFDNLIISDFNLSKKVLLLNKQFYYKYAKKIYRYIKIDAVRGEDIWPSATVTTPEADDELGLRRNRFAKFTEYVRYLELAGEGAAVSLALMCWRNARQPYFPNLEYLILDSGFSDFLLSFDNPRNYTGMHSKRASRTLGRVLNPKHVCVRSWSDRDFPSTCSPEIWKMENMLTGWNVQSFTQHDDRVRFRVVFTYIPKQVYLKTDEKTSEFVQIGSKRDEALDIEAVERNRHFASKNQIEQKDSLESVRPKRQKPAYVAA